MEDLALKRRVQELEDLILAIKADAKTQLDEVTETCVEEISTMEKKIVSLEQQLEQSQNKVKMMNQKEAETTKEYSTEKTIMIRKLADLTDQIEALKNA